MTQLKLAKQHPPDTPEQGLTQSQVGRVIEELCPTVIVWAVDLDERPGANAPVEKLFDEVTENRKVVIEPVHVLLPDSTSLPMRLFQQWSNDVAFERADKIRSTYRQSRSVRGPRILRKYGESRSDGVGQLLEYAEQIGADLIVARSRKRNPVMRFLRPGFTDELVERAKVPVLLFTGDSPLGRASVNLYLPALEERNVS